MVRTIRSAMIVCAAATALSCSPPRSDPPADRTDAELVAATGRDAVEANCTSCHQTNQITRSSGYTREHWDILTASMVTLPEEQKAQVLDYLAEHYPPNERRASRRVDGPLEVTFQEFVAPQLGERSRDPVQAPDGSVW